MTRYGSPGEQPGIYGFAFVNSLKTQLQELAIWQAANASDPAQHADYLVDALRKLPDATSQAWQERGVRISSDEEAARIQRESMYAVFDNAAEQADREFTQLFLEKVDDLASQERPALKRAELLGTIFARTLNNADANKDTASIIAGWAADHLDENQLEGALGKLNREARQTLSETQPNPRVAAATGRVIARVAAADRKRLVDEATRELKRQVNQARRENDAKERQIREKDITDALMSAKDAEDFWRGYARFAELVPHDYPDPEGRLESRRRGNLYDHWRRGFIGHSRQKLAAGIVECYRPGIDLFNLSEGNMKVERTPLGHSIFPDFDSLVSAMDDFYAPRDNNGVLLEKYFSLSAEANKEFVHDLLNALRAWQADENSEPLFDDPMRQSYRGGSGDILDYRGTALEDLEIQVQRLPDGRFMINQLDIGVYRGTILYFGDHAKLSYKPDVPEAQSTDQTRFYGKDNQYSETLRPTPIPGKVFATHIQQALYPERNHVADTIHSAIVRPHRPYEHSYKPTATVQIEDTIINIISGFHDTESGRHLPPDADGTYRTSYTAIASGSNRIYPPKIEVALERMTPLQAAVIWALGTKKDGSAFFSE